MLAASLENVPIPQLLERYLEWVQECKRAVNQLRTTIKSNRRHKERCCQVGPAPGGREVPQQLGSAAGCVLSRWDRGCQHCACCSVSATRRVSCDWPPAVPSSASLEEGSCPLSGCTPGCMQGDMFLSASDLHTAGRILVLACCRCWGQRWGLHWHWSRLCTAGIWTSARAGSCRSCARQRRPSSSWLALVCR